MKEVSIQSVSMVILLQVAVMIRSAMFGQFHENNFYTQQATMIGSFVFNYFPIQASVLISSPVAGIKRSNFGEMENWSKVCNTQIIVNVSIWTKQIVFWRWLLRKVLLSGELIISKKSEKKKSPLQWRFNSTPPRKKL